MRALIVLLGLLALAAGCTSDPAPAPPAPIVHPPVPRVPDRDENAVLATVINLDPCLLVGAKDAQRRRPHLCIVELPDHSSVHVSVDNRFPRAARFGSGTKVIDDAKVDGISAATPDLCRLEVPVSFDYAITIDVLAVPSNHKCKAGDGTEYAAKVIANLRDLQKVQHPANRPDLSKDACTVLDNALRTTATKADPDQVRTRTNIDECYGGIPGLGTGAAAFSMLIEPGPPEGGWGTKWATIAGKSIYLGDDKCQWTWSEGTYSGDDNRLVTLSINQCTGTKAQMTALVDALIKELGAPQVPGTVSPLTYRADEPDDPSPGACADYLGNGCDPYQPTPLPADVSAAAEADGYVLCAATVDAVNAKFPGMLALVVGSKQAPGCSYVRPDHAVQLDFGVFGSSSPIADPKLARKITVAGHPGEYSERRADGSPPTTTVCVDSGKQDPKTSENYHWCVTATFRVPRNGSGKPDTAGQTELQPLMAEVAKHF